MYKKTGLPFGTFEFNSINFMFKLINFSIIGTYNFNETKIFKIKKYLTAVGFEPTPVYTDQNTHLEVMFQT